MRFVYISYAVCSIILAFSPLWVKAIFLKPVDVSDNFGSGADPFIWFSYTLLFFMALVVVQLTFVSLEKHLNRSKKIALIVSSFLLWALVLSGMAIRAHL